MYNTANNWCKLFLIEQARILLSAFKHAKLSFWFQLCWWQAFQFIVMLKIFNDQISYRINRCPIERGIEFVYYKG